MALFASISPLSISTTQIPRPLNFKRRLFCPLATLRPPSPESPPPPPVSSKNHHPSKPLVESSRPPSDSGFNYALANPPANRVVQFIRSTESNIERAIFDFRFLALLAVVGSLAGSLLCFLNGCVYIIDAYKVYWTSCVKGIHTGKMVLRLVEAIGEMFWFFGSFYMNYPLMSLLTRDLYFYPPRKSHCATYDETVLYKGIFSL